MNNDELKKFFLGDFVQDVPMINIEDCQTYKVPRLKTKMPEFNEDIPTCFGSDPSPQAQAENDCNTCDVKFNCFMSNIQPGDIIIGVDVGHKDGDKTCYTVFERVNGVLKLIKSWFT
jgi:hypothetical protein